MKWIWCALIVIFLVAGSSCSKPPQCHLNGTFQIKFFPCDGKKPTKLELRRRPSAHRL